MTSSLREIDVGTLSIDTCVTLLTKEPYLLSHCLWLDDKGVELIQTKMHVVTKQQNNPVQAKNHTKKSKELMKIKKGITCPATPKGSMFGNMPPMLGREEPGNWPARNQ